MNAIMFIPRCFGGIFYGLFKIVSYFLPENVPENETDYTDYADKAAGYVGTVTGLLATGAVTGVGIYGVHKSLKSGRDVGTALSDGAADGLSTVTFGYFGGAVRDTSSAVWNWLANNKLATGAISVVTTIAAILGAYLVFTEAEDSGESTLSSIMNRTRQIRTKMPKNPFAKKKSSNIWLWVGLVLLFIALAGLGGALYYYYYVYAPKQQAKLLYGVPDIENQLGRR